MMAIPATIKLLANKVRTAVYGKEVRESIAKSMEETGETALVAKETASAQIERVDRIIATAGNDNTEIVDARGGEVILGNRLNKIDANLAQIVQNNPKNYGAIGDGVTDDTQAFKSLANVLNTWGKKSKITIPNGTYVWKEGIHFHHEVEIVGDENTWIDYQGTGIMLKLGKDGITESDFQNFKRFEVKGVGFKGGINMTHGIYTNKWVTQPRVLNCNFENFGNPNAWGIYFDDDCWDGLVQGCRWDSSNDGVARNFIGMYGRGNSRIRIFDNLITNLVGKGTAIYLNGFNCQISRNKIEGFPVNIRLGGLSSYSHVIDNYFEKSGAIAESGCIEIGSVEGDNGANTTPVQIIIEHNYCNSHLVSLETASYFIRPTKATDLIKEMIVTENYINSYNTGGLFTEIIKQNNIPGQTGNVAYGNRYININRLNTPGNNIANWSGNDAFYSYQPIADEDRYYDLYMGKAKNNNLAMRFRRYDGSVAFQLNSNTVNETLLYNNSILMLKMFSDGRIGFGKSSVNAKYDFNGDVKATHFRIDKQQTAATVENGSLFEDTNGNLYYKNLAGVVKPQTT